MAFGLEFTCTGTRPVDGYDIRLRLYTEGGSGNTDLVLASSQPINAQDLASFEHGKTATSIISPIVGTAMAFTISDPNNALYDMLDDLDTFDMFGIYDIDDGGGYDEEFRGWVRLDIVEKSTDENATLTRIGLVDGLKMLEDIPFVQSSGDPYSGAMTLLEGVCYCLQRIDQYGATGISALNVAINTDIYAKEMSPGDVPMEVLKHDASVFADKKTVDGIDMFEPMSCYKALTQILFAQNAQIRQQRGMWIVQSASQRLSSSKSFTIYNLNAVYQSTDVQTFRQAYSDFHLSKERYKGSRTIRRPWSKVSIGYNNATGRTQPIWLEADLTSGTANRTGLTIPGGDSYEITVEIRIGLSPATDPIPTGSYDSFECPWEYKHGSYYLKPDGTWTVTDPSNTITCMKKGRNEKTIVTTLPSGSGTHYAEVGYPAGYGLEDNQDPGSVVSNAVWILYSRVVPVDNREGIARTITYIENDDAPGGKERQIQEMILGDRLLGGPNPQLTGLYIGSGTYTTGWDVGSIPVSGDPLHEVLVQEIMKLRSAAVEERTETFIPGTAPEVGYCAVEGTDVWSVTRVKDAEAFDSRTVTMVKYTNAAPGSYTIGNEGAEIPVILPEIVEMAVSLGEEVAGTGYKIILDLLVNESAQSVQYVSEETSSFPNFNDGDDANVDDDNRVSVVLDAEAYGSLEYVSARAFSEQDAAGIATQRHVRSIRIPTEEGSGYRNWDDICLCKDDDTVVFSGDHATLDCTADIPARFPVPDGCPVDVIEIGDGSIHEGYIWNGDIQEDDTSVGIDCSDLFDQSVTDGLWIYVGAKGHAWMRRRGYGSDPGPVPYMYMKRGLQAYYRFMEPIDEDLILDSWATDGELQNASVEGTDMTYVAEGLQSVDADTNVTLDSTLATTTNFWITFVLRCDSASAQESIFRIRWDSDTYSAALLANTSTGELKWNVDDGVSVKSCNPNPSLTSSKWVCGMAGVDDTNLKAYIYCYTSEGGFFEDTETLSAWSPSSLDSDHPVFISANWTLAQFAIHHGNPSAGGLDLVRRFVFLRQLSAIAWDIYNAHGIDFDLPEFGDDPPPGGGGRTLIGITQDYLTGTCGGGTPINIIGDGIEGNWPEDTPLIFEPLNVLVDRTFDTALSADVLDGASTISVDSFTCQAKGGARIFVRGKRIHEERKEWGCNCTFSATDDDTVAWGSGTLWTDDGRSFSISADDTDTAYPAGMVVGTTYWIYWDPDTSTTAFQCTNSFANAVGYNRILIAMAGATPYSADGAKAFVHVRRGFGIYDRDQIGYKAISADNIYVTELSAIAANVGTLTAGTINGVTGIFGSGDEVTLDDDGITIEASTSKTNMTSIQWFDTTTEIGYLVGQKSTPALLALKSLYKLEITSADTQDVYVWASNDLDLNAQNDIILDPTAGEVVIDGLSWPTSDGTTNYYLQTNGAGQLGWGAGGSGMTSFDWGESGDTTEITDGEDVLLSATVPIDITRVGNTMNIDWNSSGVTLAYPAMTDHFIYEDGAAAGAQYCDVGYIFLNAADAAPSATDDVLYTTGGLTKKHAVRNIFDNLASDNITAGTEHLIVHNGSWLHFCDIQTVLANVLTASMAATTPVFVNESGITKQIAVNQLFNGLSLLTPTATDYVIMRDVSDTPDELGVATIHSLLINALAGAYTLDTTSDDDLILVHDYTNQLCKRAPMTQFAINNGGYSSGAPTIDGYVTMRVDGSDYQFAVKS
jgi:hypothetical protein